MSIIEQITRFLPWRPRPQSLQETVVNVVVNRLAENFERKPNQDLTEIGFDWALAFALKRYWPDIDTSTAIRWLREYIGVPYGTVGYTWTAAAANDVAREYAEQFGEAP